MLTKSVVRLVYLLLRLVWTVLGAEDSQTLEVQEELHKVPRRSSKVYIRPLHVDLQHEQLILRCQPYHTEVSRHDQMVSIIPGF